ncbi:piggyBac transposable element-derived protein 4-like [Schistocerca serialis cubense]|uniref:piggyBac transposable element-derived protein 4-like n=1 Tax=Schistocerca serialis cubense TaxID=2023355 RepID=UPI00214E3C80|nr:piggyBac transposable element-derived protein 4-like [Schistocerca serialis cubense]
MSRRGLRDEEIERLLCEIPSDEDSTVDTTDDESDYEASIVAEAIVSSEGEVSESEEESESTPPKRAADTAPTWGQQFNATSGMQFDSESGPSAFIRDIDDPEPIDIFEKIFPKELVQLIVFQTNLYATQSGKSFTPTTDNEIRTFLGINILMGIKRMPAYRDYWSSAPELHDRYIASLMAVNRFGWLLRNIHLNDNTLHPEKGHPGYDKLYKLRPVIKILSESFSKCYQPSKHLAIDESMIKFKGRNSMKQYMRDKPIKRGYKVWMLCDKTSYNLKFDIYTGKGVAGVGVDLSVQAGGRVSLEGGCDGWARGASRRRWDASWPRARRQIVGVARRRGRGSEDHRGSATGISGAALGDQLAPDQLREGVGLRSGHPKVTELDVMQHR